jgi:hypothetical protein
MTDTDHRVVALRFTASHFDLKQKQVMGMIRSVPGHRVDVGLGYGGAGAAIILDVPAEVAADVGRQLNAAAENLDIQVATLEVLTTEEYEQRALAEDIGADTEQEQP